MTQSATHLVGGEWIASSDRKEVRSPVDGSVVGPLHYGSAELAHQAADAAQAAFPSWAAMPARARGRLLHAAAALIDARADALAVLLARESGKLLPEAISEVRLSAEYFRWFAEEIRRPQGEVLTQENPALRQLTTRSAAGVVVSLTPWNFPCSIQARKLAPALAAGCTVVARVSDKCPLADTEMIRCLHDAGLPGGVVNLVHGPAAEMTDALLSHPAVRVVTFTGSTTVGRTIMAACAQRVIRPLLELGGDAPFIVMPDADLEAAVSGAMVAKFRNNGQSCIAANRFFVHDEVFDAFSQEFARRVDAMTVGDNTAEPLPDLGPCIDAHRADAVRAMVAEAISAGGRLVTASADVPGSAFCAPALVVDVPETARLAREEVFGPAAGLFRFDTTDDVIRRANDTEMGLAAYVYARDTSSAWRLAESLDAGIVGVNHSLPTSCQAPMGGVKQSGLGREGATLGLEEFQEVKYISFAI